MKPSPLVAGLTFSLLVPALALAAARDAHSLSRPAIASGARMAPSLAASDAADGTWEEFNLLQVQGALSVYDQAHDQLLSLGGYPRTSNWAQPLAGPLAWQPLPASVPQPIIGPSYAVQDPSTGLVYFLALGQMHTEDPQTGVVTAIPATGEPPFWEYVTLAFDAANQRLVVFGSFGGFHASPDVWVLDLLPSPAWSQLAPSGTPAPTIPTSPAVLDPVRRHMLFTSFQTGPPFDPGLTDIWALTLDGPPQWLHFPTNGLPDGSPRNPVVYEPVTDRLWTIDGQGEPYSLSLETYQWSHVPASGSGPTPRLNAGIAIDAVRHRLLVNGGLAPSFHDMHSDTWALSLDDPPTWTQLVPDATRPPIRGGASDGYDPSRRRLVVFGGSDPIGGSRNDTWAIDLDPTPAWSPLPTQGTPPPGRFWHVSAWDEARDQLVVFGGYNRSAPLGDLWTLSFASGTPTWSPIIPSGSAPSSRMTSQMVYDSARDRFLLMFGWDGAQPLNDVWELRLSPTPAWRALAPTGAPPAVRSGSMCVYDPDHDRVLVFGGRTNVYMNDLWALNLGSGDGTWQALPVPPGPSGRSLALLRRDSGQNRLLLFGGVGVILQQGPSTTIGALNDAWALNLTATPSWQPLSPTGFLPVGRGHANGAYDPHHDRLVFACGGIGSEGLNDLWALRFTDRPTPTLLALASQDVTADRVRLVWAGAEAGARATAYRREPHSEWRSLGTLLADGEGFVTLEDHDVMPGMTVEYRLGATIGGGETFFEAIVVQIPQRLLSLAARAVDGRVSFTLQLPTGDPATLSLFDVAGRSVWSRPVGSLGSGAHEVSAGDVALPAALYFARLTQGPAARFARVLIVR